MFCAWISRAARSLSGRISAWYALGFLVSLAFLGLCAVWALRDADRRAGRAEILDEFRQDLARCRAVGVEGFRAEAEREPPDAETTLVRLSDAAGRTLLLSPPAGESAREVRRVEAWLQGSRGRGWGQVSSGEEGQASWQVYAEPLPGGGWLQVAGSDRRGRETWRRLRAALLPVAPLALLAALAGGAALTARALRPIRRLADATRAVVLGGDFTARVPARAAGGHELDELNALFNQMLARNESLVRGMREALDHVAHDLRTPLTRLRSAAEAALRDPAASAATRGEALADAIEESERVLAMLRMLMDLSEAEHGAMRLDREPLELLAAVGDAADLYGYVAQERGVRLRADVPEGLRVRADRARLGQAVANLLDNAVKYSPPGGEVRIEAGRLDGAHGEVWLRVRDQGPGVAAHDLPRIWERLYRGDQSRSQPGLGLGLSLVKAIAEAHGGRVEVRSGPGAGAAFTIFLPALDPE